MTDINLYQHKRYERMSVGLCIVTLIEAVAPKIGSEVWGAQVNNTFLDWCASKRDALTIAHDAVPKGKTDKGELVKALNIARASYGIPELDAIAIKDMQLTKKSLDAMLHDMETLASHAGSLKDREQQETGAQVLARLNVLRKRHGMKPIKSPGSMPAMYNAIRHLEKTPPPGVEVKKLAPVIADDANTSRFHTKLHTNKYEKAVQRMNKKNDRHQLKSQRLLSATLATSFDLKRADVMRWVQVKNIVSDKVLDVAGVPKPEVRDQIVAFIAKRREALGTKAPKTSTRTKSTGEYLSPGDLAAALKSDPRSVRIALRKREKQLKPAWRNLKESRWAFVRKFEKDILKFLGGE